MSEATGANGRATYKYERIQSQPENPFAALIPDQQIAIVPEFTLESGVTLYNVPVAYTTRGKLSPTGDNAMVICHALTGSADVSDWWGPLLGGPGRAFDTSRFFIVCMNSLGSPYGTASPVTAKDGDPKNGRYGPEFPLTTIRDDVNLHKLILDDLGVKQVAAVIGGSLGGMFVLEWAYFGKDYVRCVVPIATSSRHSAWGISWGEAQRQSIYADPKYDDGYYSFDDPPVTGLVSRKNSQAGSGTSSPGSRSADNADPQFHGPGNDQEESLTGGEKIPTSTYFSAQSYLRYQGKKFVKRFDSNCYIAMTRKLDTHDVSRDRAASIPEALALIEQPMLVLGIESDGLFTFAEQEEIAQHVKNARLERIDSSEGHDAFLLQFEQVNRYVLEFLKEILPDIMSVEGGAPEEVGVGQLTKSSTFGEAEVEDITAW
ncbi:homoserine o-acetyltransferase [Trichoderma longibrachiatum ATCC 18648]|uniref:Homoserine o-acetyltransferase n=1 Tax=Trichoderma longibrachiatum ATCC 18648 TaxID=983965 RepID=A0A2T4C5Y7_TRILO|nr:homoserine o-acetyltransferase [Trichoderma longibrachiatum ATCC 18648]